MCTQELLKVEMLQKISLLSYAILSRALFSYSPLSKSLLSYSQLSYLLLGYSLLSYTATWILSHMQHSIAVDIHVHFSVAALQVLGAST